MSYISKPSIQHAGLAHNALGLTPRDYEGTMSTLCAGCGHDSISAGLVQAFFELGIPPHQIAKLSGIGCSSKTPAYFLDAAHGMNGVHGRMAAMATGVSAANRELHLIGVSGDGDSLSIGLGHFAHAIRRNVNMLYVIENNGVYGLTKGQFSASADVGSRAKRGEVNEQQPIDPVIMALSLGATFIGRGFSGDKEQLVPLIKAGVAHRGFAVLDVVSPCVAFNDHEGSTKSYSHTRDVDEPVVFVDFVPPDSNVRADTADTHVTHVTLADGSRLVLNRVNDGYDPTDRQAAFGYLLERQAAGELPTGLLYLDEQQSDMHTAMKTVDEALTGMDYQGLVPGAQALQNLQKKFR